ncbi:hypothetical protein GCM10009733_002090 [Nonomuraea maheshkhaliensis]|uniref:Uncharacterized protein n=1 Tax=Nonomuraea maheshkhaliensis TaxID=419590 RepID=A0ABN2EK34_9ACTN
MVELPEAQRRPLSSQGSRHLSHDLDVGRGGRQADEHGPLSRATRLVAIPYNHGLTAPIAAASAAVGPRAM